MTERSSSIAAKLVPSPNVNGVLLQRKCACGTHAGGGTCSSCARKRHTLQRAAHADAADGAPVPDVVRDVLRSPGQLLDRSTRRFMEDRFRRDFSTVRVHADARAATSAAAVGALAYTVGQHIVFGTGHYAPQSPAGRHLLAHELTHTVQQGHAMGAVSPQLVTGPANTAQEIEADHVATQVCAGAFAPGVIAAAAPVVQRQLAPTAGSGEDEAEPDFSTPQRRGGRGRATSLDAGQRGADHLRVAIIRHLCQCAGRNATHTEASTHLRPGPGFTVGFCHGRVTGSLSGDVVPSSFSTGHVTVGADLNVAGGERGVGAHVHVEGEARNTGREPEVGGRGSVRLRLPDDTQIGARGEIFRGTESGRLDTSVGIGIGHGGLRGTVDVTNPQDDRRGVIIGFGGDLPGQTVESRTCRICRCPVAYECYEDIPPRDEDVPVTHDVVARSRLRYYFRLDSDQDTRDATLHAQSIAMLDEVTRRVAAGATIRSITGYASPEDNREQPTPNQQLTLSRGQRVHDLLAARLTTPGAVPAPIAGGELLGQVAMAAPGSRLADALLDTGFGDPEDVSAFLFGDTIPNSQLSDQFLALLDRVTEPADRLRLFGVAASSPMAPQLLAAIEQFQRSRGRGRRPWEGLFGYLRYATVELAETHQEHGSEHQRTSGSLRRMGDALCHRWAQQAEREQRFGPAEPKPTQESDCPSGEPHNPEEYRAQCDYE